ncbi:MAG: peptide deformylase [Elusimicrobia bacterium RIFOXYB2_FULL_48_7]|nr:MAG: peptide deformylase [Elusimicrobia bacterium RIFOXYB2_FULL_48_7]
MTKIIEVVKYGNPVLKRKSLEVSELSGDIHRIIRVMSQLMYQNKGVGLAAPQIGVSKRIIVVDIGEGLHVFINPKIIWHQGKEVFQEGCLSFPGIYLDIKRSKEIVVEGLDNKGESIQYGAQGLLARVLQHEIDHLDGILMIDRVPKKKLKLISGQLQEIKCE